MSAPTWPRRPRAVRTAAVTALLSVALTAGLALTAGPVLPASAAPRNPLVPEITTPEMHPTEGRVGNRLERTEIPAPTAVRRTAARPTPPSSVPFRAAVTLVKPITSKSFTGFAFPGCSVAGGSATLRAAVQSKKTRTVRWVLTNGGTVTKTGKLKVKGRKSKTKVTEFSVAGLPIGAYRLDFRKSGSSKISVRLPVLVLGCVQATATCKGVTFTNPAGNLAVDLDYGPAAANDDDDDEADEGDGGYFDLGPGEARAVRTDLLTVVWSALGLTSQTQSSAGDALSLAIPQGCVPPAPVPGDNSLNSSGFADCLRAGTIGARFELGFERLTGIEVRFEVRNATGIQVLHGDAGTQNQAVGALARAGTYSYLSYLNGIDTAYEDVRFTVLDCVKVLRTCSSVTFTNPNAAGVEIDYSTKAGKHDRSLRLAGGAAKTVTWKYQTLSWFAFPPGATDESSEPGPRIFTFAGDAEQPRPAKC